MVILSIIKHIIDTFDYVAHYFCVDKTIKRRLYDWFATNKKSCTTPVRFCTTPIVFCTTLNPCIKIRCGFQKNPVLRTGFFLSKPKGLVYHHASVCISSIRRCRVVYHHTTSVYKYKKNLQQSRF